MTPMVPHSLRAPSGIRRAASHRSGKYLFTKKTSEKSTTIEIAQITLADASMAKYGTLTSKFFPDPKMKQMKITGIDARIVWSSTALAGTLFLLTFPIAWLRNERKPNGKTFTYEDLNGFERVEKLIGAECPRNRNTSRAMLITNSAPAKKKNWKFT